MSKYYIIFTFTLLLSSISYSQYTLKTPDGRQVHLKEDGTWKYADLSAVGNLKKATYKSKFGKFAIDWKPTEWTCDSSFNNDYEAWDATFYTKDYAVNAHCHESRLTIPANEIEEHVKQQFESFGELRDLRFKKTQINSTEVTTYDFSVVLNGVSFLYRGIVHSSLQGSFEFYVMTQKEVFLEDEKKIDQLLNGFKKIDKSTANTALLK